MEVTELIIVLASVTAAGISLVALCLYLFVWYVAPNDTPRHDHTRDRRAGHQDDEAVEKLTDLGYMD